MNSPEFMSETNTLVIKAKDNSKIIITRDYINDSIVYIVKFTSDISYFLTDLAHECGYLITLNGISIDENLAIIEGTLMENVSLKEEYHIVDGNQFGKFTESFIPHPEETVRLIPLTLCCDEIKEMTGDLRMIQDMVDDNILSASTKDLIKLGIIIKPQFEIISNSNNNNENDEINPEEINKPTLTIIKGKDKVIKK